MLRFSLSPGGKAQNGITCYRSAPGQRQFGAAQEGPVPNLEYERTQLVAADAHIQAALAHIRLMRASIESSRGLGFDTSVAEGALAAASDGLQVFIEHRELIERTIQDIESGLLPDLDGD
jgi:hypothetical protein